MARGGFTNPKMLLLRSCRGASRAMSGLSKFSGKAQTTAAATAESYAVSKGGEKTKEATCWFPHPKTGIYFPKGHDWVMNDVPEGAATFTQTCWFRNDDGVDNPHL